MAYDITGEKYNRLFVEYFSHRENGTSHWMCLCECGNKSIVSGNALRTGHTKSCGCLMRETSSKTRKTHGLSQTKVYRDYQNMLSRCYNTKEAGYENYGGRGIIVCDSWRESFENFWEDVKDQWYDGASLDRIDFDGNYELSNIRWVDYSVQIHNQRKRKNSSSKCKGVSWNKKANKWEAYISIDKKRVYLGLFPDEISAAMCYDDKSFEVYGDKPNEEYYAIPRENQHNPH